MKRFLRSTPLVFLSFWLTAVQADVTVYTAALIRTLEPALPEATAVAVQDGRIVAVGSLEDMEPVLRLRGGQIDRRFESRVLVPAAEAFWRQLLGQLQPIQLQPMVEMR